MSLYFSEEKYRGAAMRWAAEPPENDLSPEEAFLFLVTGQDYAMLDNVCTRAAAECGRNAETLYRLTQGETLPEADGAALRACLLRSAYACIDAGEPLGWKKTPGRHGYTGDWLSHCLLEGRLAGCFAAAAGLDAQAAQVLGILHDCGRRITMTFEHTVRGFELLAEAGHGFAALGCLSHSFMEGGRCTNCERAEPGFYVDEKGTACWDAGAERDDMTEFLAVYRFTDYDRILCYADLMATSRKILPTAERLKDIMSRRELDPVNYGLFLAETTNSLNRFRCRLQGKALDAPVSRADKASTRETLEQAFEAASAAFYAFYLGLKGENQGCT